MHRQTRYMERNSSISNRGKRTLMSEEEQPEQKRPALASVVLDALKVDSLQKLCSSLEPILRRVVSEEVERALAKIGPPRLDGRASPKRIEGPDDRKLQLKFRSCLSLPLYTGGKVEGEQGAAIHVVLTDANTGYAVTHGPEASVKLDVVVLEGDFNNEDDEGWTREEFESHVVKEREGKRPILTGDLQVTLKEGVGTLGELTFTDNSSWIRSRKFRLGLKVASGLFEGIRIREARTEAFTVKDHRGELYKKHYPPVLEDEVWRLEKIAKDGSFHKRLNNNGIFTVEEFLRLVVKDQQKLRKILGSGMSNKMWDVLLEHAKTCALGGKFYVYHPEDNGSVGVVFNNIYELSGLISGEQYQSTDSLSDSQKVYVDSLMKKAYENWSQVIEYDGKSLLNLKKVRRSARNEPQTGPPFYPYTMDHQLQLPRQPITISSDQPSENLSFPAGAYSQHVTTMYPTQSQLIASNPHPELLSISYTGQDHNQVGSMGLILGPPQLRSFQVPGPSNLSSYEGWSGNGNRADTEYMTEDEIRVRSHEMLENEDMQHLLRLFSMGNHASISVLEDEDEDGLRGFPGFPAFVQSPQPFCEGKVHSGKAVVGWLKIKAAMRWGFFIRKKAAERRARIIELEE